MKKILIVLGIFISILSFSQVENAIYSSKYVTFYEYNTYSNKFEESSSDWMSSMILCEKDYYIVIIEDGDPSDKIYWEHSKGDDGQDIYYTEDERKVIFDYDDQTITFFHEYNEYEEVYTKVMVLSKISKE